MTITTIDIKPNLLKSISKIAKKEGIIEDKALNEVIERGIRNTETKEAVFNRLDKLTNGKIKIANKDTYNPNKSNSIKDIIEAPKGFDPVKAVHDANAGKWE